MQLSDLSSGLWVLVAFGEPGRWHGIWIDSDETLYADENVKILGLSPNGRTAFDAVAAMCRGLKEHCALVLDDGQAFEVYADGTVQKLMGTWRKLPDDMRPGVTGWTEDTETGEVWSVF